MRRRMKEHDQAFKKPIPVATARKMPARSRQAPPEANDSTQTATRFHRDNMAQAPRNLSYGLHSTVLASTIVLAVTPSSTPAQQDP